jgi:hypothetical protein
VEPSSLLLRLLTGLLYQPWIIGGGGGGDCGAVNVMNDWQGKMKYLEKTYLNPAFPPQTHLN